MMNKGELSIFFKILSGVFAAVLLAGSLAAQEKASSMAYQPITMAPFSDSRNHLYGIHDDGNIVNPVPYDTSITPYQAWIKIRKDFPQATIAEPVLPEGVVAAWNVVYTSLCIPLKISRIRFGCSIHGLRQQSVTWLPF